MSDWQPVRLAPLEKWHNVTGTRKKQAFRHVGDIFRVRPIQGFGPCGCRKLQVETDYAEIMFRERGEEPLAVVVCFECEVLAD